MKKILIVSYYELKDYLSYIKELFEKYTFTVIHYPLFQYAYDANDKLENYKEHMNTFIKEKEPEIILWWFIDVPADVFKYIKINNPNIIFIMYNSDDPINLGKELFDKAKNFDIIITPCKNSIHLYKSHANVKTVLFGPMGSDPNFFYSLKDFTEFTEEQTTYECDISMLFYNFYLDKSFYSPQIIYKNDMIDGIINFSKENNYKFKLYGTHLLNELYPDYYCGEVPYYKLFFLYNFSKINIVSSPFSNQSVYIGEYVIPILSSGGLLFHDNTKDIEKILGDNKCAILYDSSNYIDKMTHILKNYDDYSIVKMNGLELAKKYTWDIWVENIYCEIGKRLFDGNIYKSLYNIESSVDPFDHWCNIGIKNREICYDFQVPDSFNHDDYIAAFNITNNPKYAYLHWFINSKNTLYLKKSSSGKSSLDPKEFNIIMEDFYVICAIFNKINFYNTRDDALLELSDYCQKIPYIKINDILSTYTDMIY